jgi:hypothetical protein
MTLNKKCLFLSQFLMLVLVAILVFGCAVPQKPQGGPRDVNPPKLLKATPANQTHNFTAKSIQLDFDEFFKLTNQYQEINISPAQEKTAEFKTNKKSLIINFKDTLQKNTTYVINFGKAITDLNEGNVLKNFTYVFSTGTHIDSLNMSGTVINTLTQAREKDVTVMLFTLKQDSLLFGKKRPTLFTTTDTSGNFTLSNLHEGLYKLYALKETSQNKIYDNDVELIAFPSKIINLQTDSSDIQLKLFRQIPPKFKFIDHKFDLDGKVLLTFNKPLDNPVLHILYPPALDNDKYVEINKTRDTALMYLKNMDFDSLRVAVFDGNKPVDTTYMHKGRKESFTRAVTLSTNSDSRGLIKPGADFKIITNTPVIAFEPSLIVLNEDSTILDNYVFQRDTGTQKHFSIKYKWKQNTSYVLTINEGALTGFFGEKNKKVIKRFKIDKPENYSQLTLKISVPDTSKSYVVELLNDQNVLQRSDVIRKNASIVYRSILAAKYKVRVVYDDNRNGKWDPGSLKEKRQPENIWLDKSTIVLRPNWEAEEVIDVPREPTP